VGKEVDGAKDGKKDGLFEGEMDGVLEGERVGEKVGGVGAGVSQSCPSQSHEALSHAASHFPFPTMNGVHPVEQSNLTVKYCASKPEQGHSFTRDPVSNGSWAGIQFEGSRAQKIWFAPLTSLHLMTVAHLPVGRWTI
jgi:hypothetical protein